MFESRRLDFADCSDCAEVWDALCYEGVPSVCDLVDFGSVFSTKATASIDTACDTFGPACSSYTARAACEGQCTNEGLYHHNMNTLGMIWVDSDERLSLRFINSADSQFSEVLLWEFRISGMG